MPESAGRSHIMPLWAYGRGRRKRRRACFWHICEVLNARESRLEGISASNPESCSTGWRQSDALDGKRIHQLQSCQADFFGPRISRIVRGVIQPTGLAALLALVEAHVACSKARQKIGSHTVLCTSSSQINLGTSSFCYGLAKPHSLQNTRFVREHSSSASYFALP